MIHEEKIQEALDRLVRVYEPLEVYLFGSYAWGSPNEESDLDLLIVIDKSELKKYRRPIAGYKALVGLNFPNEIIVYTREEFERNSTDVTTLIYKIKNEDMQKHEKTMRKKRMKLVYLLAEIIEDSYLSQVARKIDQPGMTTMSHSDAWK